MCFAPWRRGGSSVEMRVFEIAYCEYVGRERVWNAWYGTSSAW